MNTIDLFISNKRKFLSDVEISSPSARYLSTVDQVESNSHGKRIKLLNTESFPTSTKVIEDDDNMMIGENFNREELNKSTMMDNSTKHNATTFNMRCYCDPSRLSGLIPYHPDIY